VNHARSGSSDAPLEINPILPLKYELKFCGGICERTLETFWHFAYAQVRKVLRIAGVLLALRKSTGGSDE
jgi:hypothetical protein